MSVEQKIAFVYNDCSWVTTLKRPLKCKWLIQEMISKNVKGATTNLEWDEA